MMREIDRQLFVTLSEENGMYYIHNDGYYVGKFYVPTEIKARQIFKAYLKGGFREKYAVINSYTKYFDGNGYIRFTYDESDAHNYQDANGAMYSIREEKWVN